MTKKDFSKKINIKNNTSKIKNYFNKFFSSFKYDF